jgi:acyl dehydratase
MAQDATTKPTAERYLEDFVAGQTFSSGRARITAEEIQAFAAKFDPQPFHLSESAEAELLSGIGGKRLAHCRHHHATSGGERP